MFGWRKKSDGANKRTENRVAVANGWVKVGSDECKVVEWSANGFSARPCPQWLKNGKDVPIEFHVPIDIGEIEFECRALVVRCSPDTDEFGAMFVFVPKDVRATIDRYFGVF